MTTRLLLIALALICCYTAFGQSLERALIKDSTAVEPLSPYLKKVLQSTAAHLEIPIEHLDTSTLTAHYRIWAYPSGVQYPVLLRKDLRSTLVEDEYQSLQAAIIYDEDEFAEKTIPRLEVWEKTMGGQVRTSVRVYADNYWLAIRNYTILSCGYLFDHQVSMFNGTSWTDIQTPAAEESFDIGAMPGLNGQRSKL